MTGKNTEVISKVLSSKNCVVFICRSYTYPWKKALWVRHVVLSQRRNMYLIKLSYDINSRRKGGRSILKSYLAQSQGEHVQKV